MKSGPEGGPSGQDQSDRNLRAEYPPTKFDKDSFWLFPYFLHRRGPFLSELTTEQPDPGSWKEVLLIEKRGTAFQSNTWRPLVKNVDAGRTHTKQGW